MFQYILEQLSRYSSDTQASLWADTLAFCFPLYVWDRIAAFEVALF
jgi:hypothetical protein